MSAQTIVGASLVAAMSGMALLLVIGGCAKTEPAPAAKVAFPAPSATQTSIYTSLIVGTWIEKGVQGSATVKTIYNADGTFTSSWTLTGIQAIFASNGSCGGIWKIIDGKLTGKVTQSSAPRLCKIGRTFADQILELTPSTLKTKDQDGNISSSTRAQ